MHMIAVISDSHIPGKADEIPEEFLEIVDGADLTVHCGDFDNRETYEMLSEKGELIGVMGNCDTFELDDYQSFNRGEINFGVTHGKGISPRGHRPTLARIADDMGVEVLFHGHTHKQEAAWHDNKLLLNPGSCSGAPSGVYEGGNPEMMKIEVESGGLKVEMLELIDGDVKTDTKEFQL